MRLRDFMIFGGVFWGLMTLGAAIAKLDEYDIIHALIVAGTCTILRAIRETSHDA